MGAAACASTPRPASPPCPIQSLAKQNRKPLHSLNTNTSDPNQSLVFVAVHSPCRAPAITTHEPRHFYSIQMNLREKNLTCSQ
jgi:hypothetical protein